MLNNTTGLWTTSFRKNIHTNRLWHRLWYAASESKSLSNGWKDVADTVATRSSQSSVFSTAGPPPVLCISTWKLKKNICPLHVIWKYFKYISLIQNTVLLCSTCRCQHMQHCHRWQQCLRRVIVIIISVMSGSLPAWVRPSSLPAGATKFSFAKSCSTYCI